MGPKKTPHSAPKTISSLMEAEQPMWIKKMEKGICGKRRDVTSYAAAVYGFHKRTTELVPTKIKDMEEKRKRTNGNLVIVRQMQNFTN